MQSYKNHPTVTIRRRPVCYVKVLVVSVLRQVTGCLPVGHDRGEFGLLLEQSDLSRLPVKVGDAGQTLEPHPVAMGHHEVVETQGE